MAELVDALRSGRSGRKAVEVRVLFWAPFVVDMHLNLIVYFQTVNTLPTWLPTFASSGMHNPALTS